MVSGRLRTYDRDQIAEDLIEWAKKPDSINLNAFCAYYKTPIPPKKISEWAKEDDFFRESVEIAKGYLGARREEWLNQELLHVKGYDLNAKTYDYFLKEESRDEKKFESELDANKSESVPEDYKKVFDGFMGMVKDAQSSTFNKDEMSNKAE